jgi:protein ImuB
MFAVLHIADFPLHAVLRTEPGPPPARAALCGTQGRKTLLLAATPAARTLGVAAGLTSSQALARVPDLVLRPRSAAAETEARAALLAVATQLSPTIEDTAPGVCTADLRGFAAGPDPGRRAAAAVAQLSALGLPATAGLARTPLLALQAARAGTGGNGFAGTGTLVLEPSPPACAEPDLAASWPDVPPGTTRPAAGVLVVTGEEAFLSPLPLACAEPPGELVPVLAGWGVRTLGELAALPPAAITRRLGAAGLALWQRARGGEPRPLAAVVATPNFTARLEFEEPMGTLEPLLFVLRRLLDRLTLELHANRLVAAAVEIRLGLEDETRHERTVRLAEATADAGILFRALQTHLAALQTSAALTSLELKLVPARPLVRQAGLFDSGLRDPHGFADPLAQLAALVVAGRLGTPRLEDSHRPDAVRLVTPAAVVPPPAAAPVHAPLGPVLRRFRPPLPARLEFSAGERQPGYVWTERFHGAIQELRGPWRGSGDWWQDDRRWSRLEWDIALTGGGLYRLLRVDEAYYIEGEYD